MASTFTHKLESVPPMPSNASAVRVVNSLVSKSLHHTIIDHGRRGLSPRSGM